MKCNFVAMEIHVLDSALYEMRYWKMKGFGDWKVKDLACFLLEQLEMKLGKKEVK